MARLILATALLAMTASQAYATADTDNDAELETVAALAGVSVDDLAGASDTTGLDPREYLYRVGELARPVVTNPRVECLIAKESGFRDVPNRQGSGATGWGQYMPGTWRAHTLEMGMPWLNIHSLPDVRQVMEYDLSRGRRSQWTVSGC